MAPNVTRFQTWRLGTNQGTESLATIPKTVGTDRMQWGLPWLFSFDLAKTDIDALSTGCLVAMDGDGDLLT